MRSRCHTLLRVVGSLPALAMWSCGNGTGPSPAERLAFTVQPDSVEAGDSISPPIQVAVRDEEGNTVDGSTASITVAITSGTGTSGAELGGTLTRAAVDGVSTFDDLTVDKAGTGYTLTATAADLMSSESTAFSVTPGAASKLAFTEQPSDVAAGASISPAIQVTVQDALGNTVTDSEASITVAITSGTGTSGAELGGTLTRAAVDGVATFGDLTVDKVGADYTLTATAADLESSVSAPFTVTLVLSGEGPNISTWEFAFGDGNIPPDATSTEADYTVSHVDSMSTITVNSRQRPDVGLHGIYLLRRETDAALTAKMTYSIQFRLPDAVSIAAHQAGNPTGQTIDMTLFSWDGKTSRRDYGFAISIITNPYFQTGHVRYWVTDADGNGSWEDTGVVLDLDTEWHTVELSVDPVSDSGVAKIDEAIVVTAPRAKEAKPTFGDDVTARVSVEVISVDPGSDNGGRSARLQVRNWSWIWSPDG